MNILHPAQLGAWAPDQVGYCGVGGSIHGRDHLAS